VRVGGRIDASDLAEVPAIVQRLEALGFDAALAGELTYDPFLQIAIASQHTTRMELGTGVAIAFPRNPVQTAQAAWDLQRATHGRFVLGLGTQVRAHIERRYGVEWSKPVERMREFVTAIRAVWRSWQEGSPLDFRGEFYTHTLMTPMFNPGSNPYGEPRIWLAAIGPRMCEMAAEVADGVLMHSFASERYLREVMLPAIERGLARSGKPRSAFEVECSPLFVTGDTPAEIEASERALKDHLALYGSTPAYRRIVEVHGWGDLQPKLNELLKQDRRDDMRGLITDEMMESFAVRGASEEIAALILDRFGGLVDRVALRPPYGDREARWIEALHADRKGGSR
jgi:probable F420-dependent oxidoreductase